MWSAFTDALSGLAAPLRSLLVALIGAAAAWLWFKHDRLLIVVLAVGAVLVGLLIDLAGRHTPASRPKLAITLMEWWIVVPMVLGAIAAAAAIVVTVGLAVPDGTAASTKETIGALATAITSFLASGFVDRAADEDGSAVSDRIKAHFWDKYQPLVTPGSDAANAVFAGIYATPTGGVEGWGRSARRTRADGLAGGL